MPWAAAVIAGGTIVASLLKSHAANKSAKEQTQMWNDYLAQRKQVGADIMDKLIAAGYDPFGPQTSTQFNTTTGVQNSSTHQVSAPTFDAGSQKLKDAYDSQVYNALNAPTALKPGETERAVSAANSTFAGATQAARNMAARKGLSGAATFGAAMPIESARAGKIADIFAAVPDKERAVRDDQLAQALAGANLGKGTTTDSTTHGTSSSSSSGTMTTPPNISAIASLLMPQAPNQGTAGQGTAMAGQAVGDTASVLAWLYSQGYFNKGGSGSTTTGRADDSGGMFQ